MTRFNMHLGANFIQGKADQKGDRYVRDYGNRCSGMYAEIWWHENVKPTKIGKVCVLLASHTSLQSSHKTCGRYSIVYICYFYNILLRVFSLQDCLKTASLHNPITGTDESFYLQPCHRNGR